MPLERTDAPGIYRRGSRYVVVYRAERRHGARLIPLTPELAATLRAHRPPEAVDDVFVFRVATAVRPIRAACAAACSSPPPSARD